MSLVSYTFWLFKYVSQLDVPRHSYGSLNYALYLCLGHSVPEEWSISLFQTCAKRSFNVCSARAPQKPLSALVKGSTHVQTGTLKPKPRLKPVFGPGSQLSAPSLQAGSNPFVKCTVTACFELRSVHSQVS